MLSQAARVANAFLAPFGLRLMTRGGLYPWQMSPARGGSVGNGEVPDGAAEYLRYDNPRLVELLDRYSRFDPQVTAPAVWTEGTLNSDELLHFRGDNAFVWQLRGLNFNELTYAMSYYALKTGPASDLLAAFSEDGLFGAHCFKIDGRIVTRDLLDSVREVDFIRTHVGLQGRTILDIGAGYGRLAHRLSEAEPSLTVYATDAFAPSTFVAEYYLGFRGARQARALPLDEAEGLLRDKKVDLATNVHSFSECTPEAVAWWARRLAEAEVPRLMIIPNGEYFDLSQPCRYNGGKDMEATLGACGYTPVVRELRYADPAVQKYGVDPCQIALFELR